MKQKGKLATVCALLNARRVRYVIVGGYAVSLHGAVRTTVDIDVLIEPTLINARRTLAALELLPFGIAGDIDPNDLISRAITVIGDIPNVDILTVAWSVRFADAGPTALRTRVDGVTVPYLDFNTLVRSKQTGRLQDAADIEALRQLRTLDPQHE